jgi:sugar phosphate isomerase/epimerase
MRTGVIRRQPPPPACGAAHRRDFPYDPTFALKSSFNGVPRSMIIGLKLDMGFQTSYAYRELFADRDAPGHLRALGVQAVETPLHPDARAETVRDHIRRCCDAGLRLSFHPYTELEPANPAHFFDRADNPCRRLHAAFFELAAEAACDEHPVIVNMHAAADRLGPPRSTLLSQSIAFFRWAGDWCAEQGLPVRPVVELQIRPQDREQLQRIGDHYGELCTVVEAAGVGVCWDFGHAAMNHRRFELPLDPPAGLLPHIAHVHCHDINGDDHHPLLFDGVPWRRFLTTLRHSGFDGTVVLEVPASRFLHAGGHDALERSLALLRALRETTAGA